MKQETVITALDIGTTKVCAIIAELNEDNKFEIRGVGKCKTQGFSGSKIIDMIKATDTVSKALNEASKMAEHKPSSIYVSISGKQIQGHNSVGRIALPEANEASEITANHIDNVITNAQNNIKMQYGAEGYDILHAIPQHFEIDGQSGILNPIRMFGYNLIGYIHVVTAPHNLLRNFRRCVEYAGYKVKAIILQSIASSLSVLSEDEKDMGAIVIDIGGSNTDIALYYKGSIRFSAVLQTGGIYITEDLLQGLQTTPSAAEELKITYGSAIANQIKSDETIEIEGIGGRAKKTKSKKYICEIIEARMREILEESYRVLNENCDLPLITGGLTITGGVSHLKNVDLLATDVFNMSTKIGYPDLSNFAGLTDEVNDPRYSTCIGILRYVQDHMKKISKDQIKKSDSFHKFFQKIGDFFKDFV